jgi:hypothetical protein
MCLGLCRIAETPKGLSYLPVCKRDFWDVVDFPLPVSVAEVLRSLREQAPALGPYTGFGPKDKHVYGLLVWCERKLIGLDDILAPTDEWEMITMVAGG